MLLGRLYQMNETHSGLGQLETIFLPNTIGTGMAYLKTILSGFNVNKMNNVKNQKSAAKILKMYS